MNFFDATLDECRPFMDSELLSEAGMKMICAGDRIGSVDPEDFILEQYCLLHKLKYGEEFAPNKRNGVW